MPTNTAAWIPSSKFPLTISSAPYTSPGPNEILIQNHAVAINPLDWIKQRLGSFLYSHIKYPFILGSDVSGTIAALGPNITSFAIGDRVVAHALGMKENHNRPAESAYQSYTLVSATLTARIPDSTSFEAAAVIPLAFSTAASGLFQKDYLALDPPTLNPKPTGKTLLVWGGSTSVGCNAIQLAVAAGYDVFTTCSPRNFGLVKALGAAQAFDYSSPTVVADIVSALAACTVAGAYTVGTGSAEAALDILGHTNVKGNKFIAMASFPMPYPPPAGAWAVPKIMASFLPGVVGYVVKGRMRGVGWKFVVGDSLADNEVGEMVWRGYLEEALRMGKFMPAPEPEIVGKGLEHVQGAFKMQIKGVSARKLVVCL
ncbi:hypothetical protein MMC10_004290 [Thelotrema lepadinum]|nr:hypothetical protein [Thelotrema lepadinum]